MFGQLGSNVLTWKLHLGWWVMEVKLSLCTYACYTEFRYELNM